jgi:serine/threonine-protein kinase
VSLQQQKSSPASPGEQVACVVCASAVTGARCEQCGVAVAPGGWRVLRQIAKGPHSRVFLAEKNGQQVALKELLFALIPEAAQLEGFEREARLLASLSHPSIPKLIEFFKEGQGIHTRLYLAQDFVRGKSLLEQLDGHRFDEREAKQLARSLLEILGYLHGLSPRVIHRDLKPANVMRRDDGSIALVDFGSARDLVRGITHGSTLVGTFGYMPPEQLGGTVDMTSDLYALGATLVHLLSRKSPDEMLKPGMELVFDGEVNVSDGFRDWLKKLVHRERPARFQSTKLALKALDALEEPAPAKMREPERPRGPSAPASGWKVALVLGGVLLGAAVIFSGLLMDGRPAGKASRVSSTPVTYTAPVSAPKPAAPVVAPTPPRDPSVITVAKPRELAPFTIDSEFSVPVDAQIQLADKNASGTACEPAPSSLTISQVRAIPGAPATLIVTGELKNGGGPAGCSHVFVNLLDQNGGRAVATLLSNVTSGTTKKTELKLGLPANSRKVQLRLGPQAKPYAVFSIDLAAQRVTRQ